jgi:hypothetical protein
LLSESLSLLWLWRLSSCSVIHFFNPVVSYFVKVLFLDHEKNLTFMKTKKKKKKKESVKTVWNQLKIHFRFWELSRFPQHWDEIDPDTDSTEKRRRRISIVKINQTNSNHSWVCFFLKRIWIWILNWRWLSRTDLLKLQTHPFSMWTTALSSETKSNVNN